MGYCARLGVTSLVLALFLAAPGEGGGKNAESPFVGKYAGVYNLKGSKLPDQSGEFTLHIDASGRVSGKERNFTSRTTAPLSGFVNPEGQFRLALNFGRRDSFVLTGTLKKIAGGKLQGTFYQFVDNEFVARFEIDFTAK